MTDTVRALLELALRLEQLRTTPPAPLHLHLRQRDGPREGKHPGTGAPARTAALRAPQRTSSWNWKSKGAES